MIKLQILAQSFSMICFRYDIALETFLCRTLYICDYFSLLDIGSDIIEIMARIQQDVPNSRHPVPIGGSALRK